MTSIRIEIALHKLVLSMVFAAGFSGSSAAQPDMEKIDITTHTLGHGIYMLKGYGGNIGVSVGDDATFLIDDQFAPLTEKITNAVNTITDRPVDYVLNTHWHFDHTGGNENLGQQGALLMAHDNVHKRMQSGQTMASGRVIDPAKPEALPVLTFNDTLTLRVNGLTIRGMHVPKAHTDGDTMVHFVEANIVHMGDTFFNGRYPFIDHLSGGGLDGVIAAADLVLGISDDATQIIPGHGDLANKADLERYKYMLITIRERVLTAIESGQSLTQIQEARLTADFDAQWANGGITPGTFLGFVFESLSQ